MKISLKWLNDYVEIKDYFSKPKDLAALLTAAGLEVESISDQAKQFEFVVVGNILKKEQHPNADRLSLCQVSTGEGRIHQIVCGAQNHKTDDNVVVALPGAILPGDFAIKISKIRGVESSGMLCSEKELGLKSESEGILILPSSAPIGKSYAEYMGLDDILFELKVTPNRADCLSHFGLAREIACLLGRECILPIESLHEAAESTQKLIRVEVKKPDLCPRYAGRVVSNVNVAPSPEWLKRRLESVGVKPINNVVDVTNYVMLELGQPLHAFDMNLIEGARLSIDVSVAGEKFVSLDGTEKTLTGEELTIRDSRGPVALAGIIGGKNSGIQENTKSIFIEAAYFVSTSIRKTSRAIGIETDSSYRFSRGVNVEAVPLAMNRAAQLIQKVSGGEIAANAYDIYPETIKNKQISISIDLVSNRLGYQVGAPEFVNWMKRLGCQLTETSLNTWDVLAPVFRTDINIDMDLVEEFARLHGYQNIPEKLPTLDDPPSQDAPSFQNERRLRRIWVDEGYQQTIHYAFTSEKLQANLLGETAKLTQYGLKSIPKPIRLINPLSEDIGVMRTSLTPGLIKTLSHNFNNSVDQGRIFELGFAHSQDESENSKTQYLEESRLGAAIWGVEANFWLKTALSPSAFALKSTLGVLFKKLSIQKVTFEQSLTPADFLHPKQSAIIVVEGKPIGYLGSLHPKILEEYKIRSDVAILEINVDKLMFGQPRSLRYQSISRMPFTDRDLSFVMPKDLPVSEVEDVIRKTSGHLLKEIRVVDVFKGGNLKDNQQSVSFRLIFQDPQVSLADGQVNELRDQIVNAVGHKFQISLR